MSFSYNVKKELCGLMTDRDRKFACLYGMLIFCKNFDADNIVFQTENDMVRNLFCSLADDVLERKGVVSVTENRKKNGSSLYTLCIERLGDREEIIYRYHISARSLVHRILRENINNNDVFAFVAGAFLSCGSICEPIKDYHLEFSVPYYDLMCDLTDLLGEVGFSVKSAERKGNHIIYIKDSEEIEDIITFMGATMSSIELMNVKILKDVRNKANRIANCDAANIDRTLKASDRQIADIEYIIGKIGYENMPPDLAEVAEKRMEFPEMSLKELGEELDKPLGRSGVNHRLMRIAALAEELREEYGS